MKEIISYKFRIYPTEEQEILLAKIFGCKRFIFNHYLAEQQVRYTNQGKHLTNFDINKDITKLKDEFTWLREVDDWALKNAAQDLSVAYQNFFKSVKKQRKGNPVSAPTFKNKNSRQSYRTRGAGVKIRENSIRLPKLKEVKAVIHRPIPENAAIKSATISRNPDGRYYLSVLVEQDVDLLPQMNREVGCDLGLKDLLITSDGIKFKKPDELPNYVKTKRKLKRLQKKFARTDKTSKNHEKLRIQIAKTYSRLTRIRNEYYHLVSRYLVDNYDSIYVEDLAVSNMIKNKKLSRAIHEVAWATLSQMIAYKSMWYGRTYHKIDRFYASSKTCSVCEYKLSELSLSTRKWTCQICHTTNDRDLNAATNILHKGQDDLYGKIISQATGDMGEIPTALVKMTSKTERSGNLSVDHGTEQATMSLDSWWLTL